MNIVVWFKYGILSGFNYIDECDFILQSCKNKKKDTRDIIEKKCYYPCKSYYEWYDVLKENLPALLRRKNEPLFEHLENVEERANKGNHTCKKCIKGILKLYGKLIMYLRHYLIGVYTT